MRKKVIDNPQRTPPYFRHAVYAFSLYAMAGFLLVTLVRPFSLSRTLLVTLLPAGVYFLLLQAGLYLQTNLRWAILRHGLDTLFKIGFLVALAPLLNALVVHGWLTATWGLLLGVLGILVLFVLYAWGVEMVLQRLLGKRTSAEESVYSQALEKLNALPTWRIVFLLIPHLKPRRPEGS